jgi:hypothetical protein
LLRSRWPRNGASSTVVAREHKVLLQTGTPNVRTTKALRGAVVIYVVFPADIIFLAVWFPPICKRYRHTAAAYSHVYRQAQLRLASARRFSKGVLDDYTAARRCCAVAVLLPMRFGSEPRRLMLVCSPIVRTRHRHMLLCNRYFVELSFPESYF